MQIARTDDRKTHEVRHESSAESMMGLNEIWLRSAQTSVRNREAVMSKRKVAEILGVGVLTMLVAVFLNKAYEKLGLSYLLAGLGCVLLLIGVNVVIVVAFLRSERHLRFREHVAIVRQLVEPRRFPWLVSGAELNELEGTAKGREIWVVSPDLSNDTGDALAIPIVKANAGRGTIYSYVVPNTPVIRARIAELREVFAEHKDKLNGAIIPQSEFCFLSHTHLVVYNPRGEQAEPGRVLLELPVKGRNWWVEMSRDDAACFIGSVAAILDGRQECVREFRHLLDTPHSRV